MSGMALLPHVCFVAPSAFGALSGRCDLNHIGGAEVQQVLLARELARRGATVSFVTEDHGQGDEILADGIRVFGAYRIDAGLPGVRFLHPRCTGLWSAMKRADADVYYQRMREATTGVAAAFVRSAGRRFVFSAAHDYDCLREPPRRGSLRERVLYRYGLRRATRVLAQTAMQQRLFREQFGIEAWLVPNGAVDPIASEGLNLPDDAMPRRLLWVGAFRRAKRLELLCDVAKRCPEVTFEVVGKADAGSAYGQQVEARAAGLGNVTLRGFVPHQEMGARYRESAALICTSSAEGFPNTFLEAWSRGRPVLTTWDGDGTVKRAQLGLVADDAEGLAAVVKAFFGDAALRRWLAANARDHFLAHHTPAGVVDRLLEVIAGTATVQPEAAMRTRTSNTAPAMSGEARR